VTYLAFNYGNNGNFGAVGHWGAPDLGWDNGGGAPAAGIWHYIVYTYDGGGADGVGTTRVYSDGVLQNSEFLGTLNTHDGHAFVIGGQNDDAGNPAGFNSGLSIAKIRVHDVALSDAEIATQFEAEKEIFFPGAFLSKSGIGSTGSFFFEITDVDSPMSVTDPATFKVDVQVPDPGWSAQGAGGVINGSITSPPLNVTSDEAVELTLTHRYNFEGDGTPANVWDGGVVQVSINAGAFTTLAGENFSQNGYFPSPIVGNGILIGENGFNGKSPGFDEAMTIDSIATIPGVSSGDTLRIRILGAWDDAVTPGGLDWLINGVAVNVGATSILAEDFSTGDGGFIAEQSDPGAAFIYGDGMSPASGDATVTKEGDVLRLVLPLDWIASQDYIFNITGKDTAAQDLSFTAAVSTPVPSLADPLDWPEIIPGPLGEDGTWGVRTYLNFGFDGSTTLPEVLSFLANADDRTPELTPDTVIDTQETDLNFVDPESNSPGQLWGVVPCSRPFPGDALSTSTNGDVARGDDNVVTTAHGTISITEQSDYTFSLRGDDGFMFRILAPDGNHPEFIASGGPGTVDRDSRNIVFFPNGTGDTNTRAIVNLEPGLYNLEYIQWEGGGGFWYQIAAAKGFFLNSDDTDTWAAIGYQSSRDTPIPYPAIVGDWTVESSLPGAVVGNIGAAKTSVEAAVAADAAAATSTWSQINFTDPGFGGTGRIPGDVPWPRDTAGVDDDNYAMKMNATLSIPEDGEYIFGFQGDDGSELTIGGNNAGFIEVIENATGATTVGVGNTTAKNSGSLGDVADFVSTTSAQFDQSGALAGSDDTALAVGLNEAERPRIPFVPALNPADAFSAEIWLFPTEIAADGRNFYSALASGNFGDPRSGWLIYMDTFAGWNFRGYRNQGFEDTWNVTGGGIPELNQWYHIVATWDGDSAKIYVNGVLDEGAQVSGITDFVNATEAISDGGLRVGSRSDNAFSWAGSADELAIYPTALDAATIEAHYQNGLDANRSKPYPDLVAESNPLGYWRFNEETQPLTNLGTLVADVPTGNSSSSGKIFLAAGEYPISATFWEAAGGSYFEIFGSAASDTGCAPLQILRTGGWPSISDNTGLTLVPNTDLVSLSIVGGIQFDEAGRLSLSFNSINGATYTLTCSDDLVNWLEIDDNIVATSNLTKVENITGFVYDPNEPKRYYRIELNE